MLTRLFINEIKGFYRQFSNWRIRRRYYYIIIHVKISYTILLIIDFNVIIFVCDFIVICVLFRELEDVMLTNATTEESEM